MIVIICHETIIGFVLSFAYCIFVRCDVKFQKLNNGSILCIFIKGFYKKTDQTFGHTIK